MGKLNIITGDIVENCIDIDAIVNSKNKNMYYGSGVCGAIYCAAGVELYKYCQNTYKECMKDCEVRVTPGFNIGCDIIHILAPRAYEYQKPLEILIEFYKNLFKTIKEKKYKKVLLPSLGAGIHGYKPNQIAKPLMTLLNEFCNNNDICDKGELAVTEHYYTEEKENFVSVEIPSYQSIDGVKCNKHEKFYNASRGE